MKVAVTCSQLARDLGEYEPSLRAAGLEVRTAPPEGQYLAGEELIEAVAGCAGVVAGDDRFTAEVIGASPSLRVISKWGIGVDGIDHGAAAAAGVTVRNTPEMFGDEVADVAMAYVVMLRRHLASIDRGVRTGRWPKPAGRSLADQTLGIVGLGNIGRALASRALAAGMRIVGSDVSPQARAAARGIGVEVVAIDSLFSQSDVVSLHCPLTAQTKGLVDGERLAALPDQAVIVNTARGELIDTAALVAALESGRVVGAALDVLDDEPVSPGHILTRFDSVIFGSHNASNTVEASQRTHVASLRNLCEQLGVDWSP